MDTPLGALSGGAGGMADAVAGIIEQRMRQAQLANQVDEHKAQIAQSQATLAETTRAHMADEANRADYNTQMGLYRDAQTAETARKDRETAANQAGAQFDKFAEQAAPGGFYTADNPNVQYAQAHGRTDVFSPKAATPDQPMVGPLEPGQTDRPTVPGTGTPGGFLKTATAAQLNTAEDNRRQAAQEAANEGFRQTTLKQGEERLGIERTRAQNEGRPIAVQTVDANNNPITQYLSPADVRGKTFNKPLNATMGNRLASADAAVQTGNDIIKKMSDPAYAQNLGVAMGRYTNFEDFLGDPPPEYSELAGEIKSFAASNLGIHGMRSGQVFDSIQKMLGPNHEPANIAATIKGINGFSERLLADAGRRPGGAAGPAAAGGGAAPKEGDTKGIDGFPGTEQTFRNGKWIRTK